jgi:cell division protein FtsB
MTKTQAQSKSRKARLFLVFNLLLLFFLAMAFGREYVGSVQIRHEIKQLEAQRESLESDQLDTLALIGELSSEYYLETEARTKHGLAREGETLIVVKANDSVTGNVLGVSEDQLDFVENYKKWFYFFFDQDSFRRLQEL